MILNELSIINYRNIKSASLLPSPKINCLIGPNGSGKTNTLDAVHYLSFCRSSCCPSDAQAVRHGTEFFVLEGRYATDDDEPLSVYCGMKTGQKKRFRRDGKEYRRFSEHIGLIPLVSVAPADSLLIDGGSEERRRLLDMVISQCDRTYIDSLVRYNKALAQRNAMLRTETEPDAEILGLWEESMAADGEAVFARRKAFVDEIMPAFQRNYEYVSGGRESVGIAYTSHCQRGPLLEVIRRDRAKDRAVGFSLHGIHRDDLVFSIEGHPMKREGSQGQGKTFVVALKLALFDFLRRTASRTTPLLLLDDVFDRLDAGRVERLVSLVAGDGFGQIFMTDTNREHIDAIVRSCSHDYRLFHVEDGEINPIDDV